MIVLGIDPGSSATGFGAVQVLPGGRLRLVEAGAFRPRSAGLSLGRRIGSLCEGLERLLDRLPVEEAAMEGLFASRNLRSALLVAQARGALLAVLSRRGLEPAEYSPMEVKRAVTGYGRAEKEQVRRMVMQLLRLPTAPAPLDASDALAVAICHAHGGGVARALRAAGTRSDRRRPHGWPAARR